MRSKKKLVIILLALGIVFYWAFPNQLFNSPYSTTLWSKSGELLAVKIADDEQWRFPEIDSIPSGLEQSILHFEDEYFHWHPGINPVSTIRALWQNINSDKIVSGGSTISMQVIRLSRKNKARSYWEKIIEMYLAFRMEFSYSKSEILKLYVSHAPYGGNIVGVEAAAWRYFQRPIHQLSQAEYATLAVLPNAPSLIHPGKNRNLLLQKRNRLLYKLYQNELIDSLEYSLSIMEPIPEKPSPLPQLANHLIDYSIQNGLKQTNIQSSIDYSLQRNIVKQIDRYIKKSSENDIRNACALVISLESKEVVAYVGNTNNKSSGAKYVDLIQAARSSGSILKPFLYALSMDAGLIHNSSILKDIPITIDKFAPKNFDKSFEGIVPASTALAKSLNIPAALLLKDYGVSPFYDALQQLGFSTINRHAGNYGLSLILGGAEVSLWDLAQIYAQQSIQLNEFNLEQDKSSGIALWKDKNAFNFEETPISEGSWWLTSKALTEVERPTMDENWRLFSSSKNISWKTGTSHGFRDAWAIGYDANYLVAVWVGNAEGDGRPGLTGVSMAAPLMFQIFQNFEHNQWFKKPEMALKSIKLCKTSGYLPSHNCPINICEIPINSNMSSICNFHEKIYLNRNDERVFKNCSESEYRDTVWFSLSPVISHYYQKAHYNYLPVPKLSASCQSASEQNILEFIYPQKNTEIIIPKDFNGINEKVVLEATHNNKNTVLYWHLNDEYLGTSNYPHKILTDLSSGAHVLMIMDQEGNSSHCHFKVH